MVIWLSKVRRISGSVICPLRRILPGRRWYHYPVLHLQPGSLFPTKGGACVSGFPESQRPVFTRDSSTFSASCGFGSTKPQEQHSCVRLHGDDDDETQRTVLKSTDMVTGLDFPGGRVAFTSNMKFLSDSPNERIPCYRVLDDDGNFMSTAGSKFHELQVVDQEVAMKMYRNMVTLQMMDAIFYEAQRQGRISFYVTSIGEEAINIASAAALSPDDVVLPQYREPGLLLWRGFTLQEFADQLFGNKADYGKGRQMPIHYGSKKHNYFTVSSPIATQIPQAAGVAYSLKMDQKNACVVTYMGDGGTSEGDFHAGLNFAAVMEVPVVFFCRNNGWSISTPVAEQFRSDGVVVKGQAYGIKAIRIDGNDALAVYNSTRAAREMAVNEQRPVLVEALTYRVGHHSTSDDSTKYRAVNEIEHWRNARNPIARFRKWVQRNGWWTDEDESQLRSNTRKQLLHAIQVADRTEKPPIQELFSDVYHEKPQNLQEQERSLKESIKRYPQDYPADVSI